MKKIKLSLSGLKIAGLFGMIGPVIFFTFTLVAISYAPWFSWTEHDLSHLGGVTGERPIWAARGIASILFNSGCMIAGILGIVFAIGLRKIQKTPAGRLGTTLFILDMGALSFVGIFPWSVGLAHGIASNSLFLLAPFSLWVVGAGYLDLFKKVWGVFSITIGIVIVVGLQVVPLVADFSGYAIPEMILAIALSVFSITFGIKLFKEPLQK